MLAVVQTALAAGVVVLRDGLTLRETLHVFDRSFRGTLLAETVLGWVFVVTWVAVGWWAPAAVRRRSSSRCGGRTPPRRSATATS